MVKDYLRESRDPRLALVHRNFLKTGKKSAKLGLEALAARPSDSRQGLSIQLPVMYAVSLFFQRGYCSERRSEFLFVVLNVDTMLSFFHRFFSPIQWKYFGQM